MSDTATLTCGPQTGSTLYAYTNEFLTRAYSFDQLLEEVARRGLGPHLEVIGFQSFRGFPAIGQDVAEAFKAKVATLGLKPSSLGINADQEIRRGHISSVEEMVAYHEPQMRVAAQLGFPVVRYQYGAGPEVIRRLAPLAEDLGLKLGLELHAPQHAHHPDVLAYREMYEQVNSPALGWIPDFSATMRQVPASYLGSLRAQGIPERVVTLALDYWSAQGDTPTRMKGFRDKAEELGFSQLQYGPLMLIFPMFGRADPLGWSELMDRVVHVHGKFYGFDTQGQEESIDYETILPVFKQGGFNGTMSSEWEGHMYSAESAFDLVEQHQAMCHKILEAA